jgi:hypothetical protein
MSDAEKKLYMVDKHNEQIKRNQFIMYWEALKKYSTINMGYSEIAYKCELKIWDAEMRIVHERHVRALDFRRLETQIWTDQTRVDFIHEGTNRLQTMIADINSFNECYDTLRGQLLQLPRPSADIKQSHADIKHFTTELRDDIHKYNAYKPLFHVHLITIDDNSQLHQLQWKARNKIEMQIMKKFANDINNPNVGYSLNYVETIKQRIKSWIRQVLNQDADAYLKITIELLTPDEQLCKKLMAMGPIIFNGLFDTDTYKCWIGPNRDSVIFANEPMDGYESDDTKPPNSPR